MTKMFTSPITWATQQEENRMTDNGERGKMLPHCTPETVKALRDGIAKSMEASEPPDTYFPEEVIAILKVFDLAGMAHYNYTHDDKLEYSTEEYTQEDINRGHNNTYLLVGVAESLLATNARLRAFVVRVAENSGDFAEAEEFNIYYKWLTELGNEARKLLTESEDGDDGK